MALYSSNCPISRPAELSIEEHGDFDGVSWNNKQGLFYATEDPLLPIKTPPVLSYRPTVR